MHFIFYYFQDLNFLWNNVQIIMIQIILGKYMVMGLWVLIHLLFNHQMKIQTCL
ncbi:hypothetical protein C1645_770918, partial [Glomus cerebriforme]